MTVNFPGRKTQRAGRERSKACPGNTPYTARLHAAAGPHGVPSGTLWASGKGRWSRYLCTPAHTHAHTTRSLLAFT